MSYKPWPDNDGLAVFNDLCTPVRTAIEFAYDIERKNAGQAIPWSGLESET